MRILFENATLTDGRAVFLSVNGSFIESITDERPLGEFDRIIPAKGKILMSALYNTHSHAAMTLFRGMGGDLELMKWLDDVILPAEDKLTGEAASASLLLGAAEMIRGGIVSFSDMYMFSREAAECALSVGMKANISRGLVAFDDDASIVGDYRFEEAKDTFDRYHMADDGRIRVDFAVHAEYTARERYVREVVEYAHKVGARLQTHLSESRGEAEKCRAKRKMTQTEFFDKCGYFSLPVTCAHCVHLTDSDMDILRERNAFISHNPTSNLKLASGIMPLAEMLKRGMNISLGTDGAASNNNQDIFKEMNLAALLAKGVTERADVTRAGDIIHFATRMGALSQGREDSGLIKEGYRADIILVDFENASNAPVRDPAQCIVYSAKSSDVTLTMCDGRILYENGEYKTLDVERALHGIKKFI